MRKRILISLLFIAIIWGVMVGIKNVKFENLENNIDNENEASEISESYVDEIKLPLIELDTLNPLKTNNTQVAEILSLIYEPLITYQNNEELEKVLISEWAKLDSNTWILKVKDNILWHNGRKMTIDDVIFTLNILKENNLAYSSNVSNIQEIIKLDEYSVKIILQEKDDYFIGKLNFPIVSEYVLKDNFENEEKTNSPIGTGAYKYVQTTSNGVVELKFNELWWKETNAKLQKIYLYKYASYGEAIKAFKSVKVDMIVTNMSKWQEKFGTIGLNAYSFENSEYEMIIPNCNNLALSDNSVRRAILQGINRESIINSVYLENATISDIPIHNNSKNSVNNSEYDLEKAKQILINAGWVQNESGWQKEINGKNTTLKFTMLVNENSEEKIEVAEKIKLDLQELGISLNIKKVSNEKLKSLIEEDNFELALTTLDIKNEFFIQEMIEENSKLNYANYSSKEMQEILENMKISEAYYEDNFHMLTQLYKNDAPYIGLYFKTSTLLTNKSVKGNINPTWADYYKNITSFCK